MVDKPRTLLVALTIALLAVVATPAGATSNSLTVVSGTIVTNAGGFAVGAGAPAPCPVPTGNVGTVDIDPANDDDFVVSAIHSTGSVTRTGGTYFVALSRAGLDSDNDGSLSSGVTDLKVEAKVYAETAAGSCVPGPLRCTATATWSGTTSAAVSLVTGGVTGGELSTGATIELDAPAVTVAKAGCSVPWTVISSVALDDIVLQAV